MLNGRAVTSYLRDDKTVATQDADGKSDGVVGDYKRRLKYPCVLGAGHWHLLCGHRGAVSSKGRGLRGVEVVDFVASQGDEIGGINDILGKGVVAIYGRFFGFLG